LCVCSRAAQWGFERRDDSGLKNPSEKGKGGALGERTSIADGLTLRWKKKLTIGPRSEESIDFLI
jgi:hypothetical protein